VASCLHDPPISVGRAGYWFQIWNSEIWPAGQLVLAVVIRQ